VTANGFRLCEGADYYHCLSDEADTSNLVKNFETKPFTRSLAKPMLVAELLLIACCI